jgi:hypothetical protein
VNEARRPGVVMCNDGAMPRLRPTSPIGIAFGAYHLWRRLPPAQRRQVMQMARAHGPKFAAAVLARRPPKR